MLDLNSRSDRELIVWQILNYGGEKMAKWLLKNFSLNEIKKVLKNSGKDF